MAADSGRLTILLPLTAAFNMISHSNLLNQLISIGLSCIQTAQLKNYQFQLFPSACGVPQDSVLGYLLFIICSHLVTSSVITVAEDTQLYLSLHLHQLSHAPLSARYQNLVSHNFLWNAVEMRQNWSPHGCPALSAQENNPDMLCSCVLGMHKKYIDI